MYEICSVVSQYRAMVHGRRDGADRVFLKGVIFVIVVFFFATKQTNKFLFKKT